MSERLAEAGVASYSRAMFEYRVAATLPRTQPLAHICSVSHAGTRYRVISSLGRPLSRMRNADRGYPGFALLTPMTARDGLKLPEV